MIHKTETGVGVAGPTRFRVVKRGYGKCLQFGSGEVFAEHRKSAA